MDFFAAFALTIIIEGAVLSLILRGRYGTLLVTRNAIIASSLTLPFVWFAFPHLGLGWGAQTAIAEAFASVAEAGFYALAFRGIGNRDALLASIACNWASFVIGLAAA